MPNTFPLDGNVGIGTTTPEKPLHIRGIGSSGGSNARIIIENGSGHQWFLNTFSSKNHFSIGRVGIADDLAIDSNGNVGIGTDNAGERLEVNGNILVTGDIKLAGADCAENFEVDDVPEIGPGMVMVISDEQRLRPCTQAYDRHVAGVLSGAGKYHPGIVLSNESSSSKRLPVALVGKVYCCVDATFSPIAIGDMLTTSPTVGHAMKATDVTLSFGAVLGKALGPLVSGTGLVPILVALQ